MIFRQHFAFSYAKRLLNAKCKFIMTVIAPVKQIDINIQDLHLAIIEITDVHIYSYQVIGHLSIVR